MSQLNILACLSRVVLTGDERAFGQIVSAYEEPVRRFFLVQTGDNGALADDLAQETFIRAWQGLDSFRRLAAFSTWLYRIAYNVWLQHLRTTRDDYLQLPLDEQTTDSAEAQLQTDALDAMARHERQEWVLRSLTEMKEPAKTILTLFYLHELSVRDIAAITQLSDSNVRVLLTRGRRQLRAVLQKNNPYQ
ncbi:MAG: sigma-70 family RNA polymerase sigma factor [Bacteroidaceae bacterium]|nr:sigma-70 family RNA polymerase sigma factor [Bacteroidaceae bacterium]